MTNKLINMVNSADTEAAGLLTELNNAIGKINPAGANQLTTGPIPQKVKDYQQKLNSGPGFHLNQAGSVCRFTLNLDRTNPDRQYNGGSDLSNCGQNNFIPAGPSTIASTIGGGSVPSTTVVASTSSGGGGISASETQTPTTTASVNPTPSAVAAADDSILFFSDSNASSLVNESSYIES